MADRPDHQFESDPGSAQREELTAYLDGELDSPASARVEQRLANDAVYRAELARLEQVWDCLDELPQTQVDDSFARTTIEMAAVAASQEIAEQHTKLPRHERRRQLLRAGCVLGCLFGGFLLAASLWPDPNRGLLRDLPVIEHLDLYQNADSVEFLRLLRTAQDQKSSLQLSTGVATGDIKSTRSFNVSETFAERRDRVRAMAPESKARLRDNQERFLTLSPAERERILLLQKQIADDSAAAALLDTLADYHEWLKQLTPGQRADLADLKPADRVRAIQKFAVQQARERATELSAEDQQVILNWFEEFVVAHRRQLLAGVAEPVGEPFDKLDERRQRGTLLALAVQKLQLAGAQMFVPTEAEAMKLVERLSPAAQTHLKSLADREEQKRQLVLWLRTALRGRLQNTLSGPDAASSEQLEQFFDQRLSSDERERLLAMPGDEMQRELRDMYARQHALPGSWLPGESRHDGPPPHRGPREGGPRPDGPRPDGRGPRPDGLREGPPHDGPPGPPPPRGEERGGERGRPHPRPFGFGRPGDHEPRRSEPGPGPRGPDEGPDRGPPPPRD